VLVLVLVLDSKRVSRSAACRSGNLKSGLASTSGKRFNFRARHDLVAAMQLGDLAERLQVRCTFVRFVPFCENQLRDLRVLVVKLLWM
jgi:hypothetical protein